VVGHNLLFSSEKRRFGRGKKMRLKWLIILTAILVSGVVLAGYVALITYDFDKLKPSVADVVKNATGRDLKIGHISLKVGLIPVLRVDDVRLQNPPWASRPDLFRIRRIELELALLPLLRRNIKVKRLVLIEPDVQVESDHSGVSNLDFGPSQLRGSPKPSSWGRNELPPMSFGKVVLKKARFCFKDPRSPTSFLVRLHILEASAESFDGPVIINFKGSYKGKPFVVQAVTGSLEELMKQEKPWSLKTTIQALGTQFWMKGSVKDVSRGARFTFSFKGQGKSTKEVTKLMDLGKVPEMGPFNVTGNVSDERGKTYRLSDLTLRGRAGEAFGSMKINLAGKRPRIQGMFSSQRLDLGPFLDAKKASPEEKRRGRIFSEEPFKADFPENLDADLRVRAKEVVTPYGSMHDVQVVASLREGQLRLKTVKAAIDGGFLASHIECGRKGKDFTIAGALEVQHFELKRVLKDVGARGYIEGTIDGQVEFNTSGDSIAAMMAKLNGKSVISMSSGRIKNRCLWLLGSDVRLPVAALLGSSQNEEDYTEIHCAVNGLQIKGGLALVTALVVDTPNTTICGTGEVDLRTEGLSLYLEPQPKKGLAGLTLSLNELAKPLMLRGTLAHPSVSFDPTKTALIVGRAIGGFLLLGPLGLVGALAGKTSEPNACASALKAAKKGVRAEEMRRWEESKKTVKTGRGLERSVYSGP
jgi:uncharacterized protein involved in outer membrane biogenesis